MVMNVVSIAGKKYNLRQRFLYGDIVRYICIVFRSSAMHLSIHFLTYVFF